MPNQPEAISLLVHEHGPIDLVSLHRLARAEGVTSAQGTETVRSAAARARGLVLLPDGCYLSQARLLAGSVLTTRWRGGRTDVLFAGRDLQPFLELMSPAGIPLASGGMLRHGSSLVGSLTGPRGWLPEVGVGELVMFRWDGAALSVSVGTDVPLGDSQAAQRVRDAVAEWAVPRPERLRGWGGPAPRSAVTDALIAVPDLLAAPVPPLSELLPLPPELQRVQDTWGDDWRTEPLVRTVAVPVSERVMRELERRADLVGERLPDYAAQLLVVAADRLLPAPRSQAWRGYESVDRYDAWEAYPSFGIGEQGSVISGPWGR